MFELTQLKKFRQKTGLSQLELARLAGVSQSLIAKIEANRIDPSFSNAQKIMNALSTYQPKELCVKTIMTKHVLSFESHSSLSEIISVMKKKGLSQVPIVKKGVLVGMVSESSILSHISELDTATVEEVMGPAAPSIDKETPISAILSLLKFSSCVLVVEKGELLGIVTKSDVLSAALKTAN